jgi:hypothetical protein
VNDYSNYLVGWQLDGDPGWGEYELVDAFRTEHAGRQPFANIETVNPPKLARIAPRPTQQISLHAGLKRGAF